MPLCCVGYTSSGRKNAVSWDRQLLEPAAWRSGGSGPSWNPVAPAVVSTVFWFTQQGWEVCSGPSSADAGRLLRCPQPTELTAATPHAKAGCEGRWAAAAGPTLLCGPARAWLKCGRTNCRTRLASSKPFSSSGSDPQEDLTLSFSCWKPPQMPRRRPTPPTSHPSPRPTLLAPRRRLSPGMPSNPSVFPHTLVYKLCVCCVELMLVISQVKKQI